MDEIPKGLSREARLELCLEGKAKGSGGGGRWISPCCNIQVGIDTVFRDPVWPKGLVVGQK